MIQRNSSGIHDGPTPAFPDGKYCSSASQNVRVSIARDQLFQPAAIRRGVIVDEGDDLSLGQGDAAIAGISEALPARVVRNPNALARQLAEFLLEAGIMIDDNDDLFGRIGLLIQRGDRLSHLREAIVRICANNNRSQRLVARILFGSEPDGRVSPGARGVH